MGDFSIDSDMKVFIDMGHDSIKAARIGNGDWTDMLNHFEIPTVLIPELHDRQQQMVKSSPMDFEKNTSSNFKFFKQNINALTESILTEKNHQRNGS